MSDESRAARRWAKRHEAMFPKAPAQKPPQLDTAAQLLSDYEDAIYAEARASVTSGDPEAALLVEMVQRHSTVRRLRLEILDLLDAALREEPARPEAGAVAQDPAV